jgi:isoleucyl-tRNA synthetase
VLSHTADEAYRALWRADGEGASAESRDRCVHLEHFPKSMGIKADEGWAKVMTAREAAMGVMELSKKAIGVENPLDMGVTLPDPDGVLARFNAVDVADLLGVSRVAFERGAAAVRVVDLRQTAPRCERSWKRDATVAERVLKSGERAMMSQRDAEAVGVA